MMVFGTSFLILFGFWIFLSGHFDLFHLSLGIISCALVSRISGKLFFSKGVVEKKHFLSILRFFKYLPWLLYQVVMANLHVAFLVLRPKMFSHIDPHIIRFKTTLKTDLSLTTFANSITLTPGTITVLIQDQFFYVHAIDQKVAEDLLSGEMEQKVAQIYKEE